MKKVNKGYMVFAVLLVAFFVLGFVAPASAEAATTKESELEEVRAAIRALPDVFSLTEADRPAVIAANALAQNWMTKYGESRLEICTLSGKLMAAAAILGVGDALPATGGTPLLASVGLLSLLTGAAMILPRKRR